jgi:hypothetical protein
MGSTMADLERTSAGFQMVLPGCEPRTLPKSASRSDETGQGLLEFFDPPTAREKLDLLASAPLTGKKRALRQRSVEQPAWHPCRS